MAAARMRSKTVSALMIEHRWRLVRDRGEPVYAELGDVERVRKSARVQSALAASVALRARHARGAPSGRNLSRGHSLRDGADREALIPLTRLPENDLARLTGGAR